MKQNYFSFYVFEPEYFDTFVIKKKALGYLRVPARDEDTDLVFVAEVSLPFSDRPIENDKLDTFILPVQDAYHALEQSFDLFFMTREVYGVFYNRLTLDDFPEDWMKKSFVKITTYGDDLCKMRVEIYLDGHWKRDNDNLLYGIHQGDTPRIDIPMVFTDEQTDSYGISEIRELRTGFKPNHTDDEIISLTTDEYTGATSITFKTPRVNLEDILWFTEDMMSSCDSDDMVTVQLTMENPAVRVVTNRVGVADKEPESRFKGGYQKKMNEYIEHKLVVKPGLGSFIVTSDGEEIKFSDCVNRLDYVAYTEALKNLEPKKKLENERYGND